MHWTYSGFTRIEKQMQIIIFSRLQQKKVSSKPALSESELGLNQFDTHLEVGTLWSFDEFQQISFHSQWFLS